MTKLGKAFAAGEELLFLPLGGAGEIGMNLNLFGYAGQWLMVDLGVTFADETLPGVEIIVPDPGFIVEHRDSLAGIVLTHAHEDHIGAVPHIWPQLRCPVYCSPFTASVLRRKLEEFDLVDELKITEVPLDSSFEVGPFQIELQTLTHSIPEPSALVIRTPLGAIMHTGDWKFDPDPLIGEKADEGALRQLGDDGILALVGDSTNALTAGTSGSEGALRESLIERVARCPNRVAVASFASNVARLETIAIAARENGRQAALVGRSLWRMYESALENGYLRSIPRFLMDGDAMTLPRDKVLLACTGSQGEARAALGRISDGTHPYVSLDEGDTVIFSSRIIPGNEKSIFRLQNDLTRLGVEIVTEKDDFVHVSGHPARDELTRMYQLVRPRIAVPVHGELRHLKAHAALARDCQVLQTPVIENGAMLRLAPGAPKVVDHVPSGRLAVEGDLLTDIASDAIRERKRINYNGAAAVTIAVDGAGELINDPQISLHGIADDGGGSVATAIALAVETAIRRLTAKDRRRDDAIAEAARLAVRRTVNARFRKRPVTTVHVVRL